MTIIPMEYLIEPAEETDAAALAHINVLSFQHQGLLSHVFPEANQDTLEAYKSMYAFKHLANPSMHVLKIVDPASDVIVGYARWLIPDSLGHGTSKPALSENASVIARDPLAYAPKPMNEALYNSFRNLLEQSRQKHTTEKDMSESLVFGFLIFARLI